MTEPLQSELAKYLAGLIYRRDQFTHDWTEQQKIVKKINLIYALVDMEQYEKDFVQTMQQHLQKLKNNNTI